MKKYDYLISFNAGNGVTGRMFIELTTATPTRATILEIEKFIQDKEGYMNVGIQSFQLLGEVNEN